MNPKIRAIEYRPTNIKLFEMTTIEDREMYFMTKFLTFGS